MVLAQAFDTILIQTKINHILILFSSGGFRIIEKGDPGFWKGGAGSRILERWGPDPGFWKWEPSPEKERKRSNKVQSCAKHF